MIKIPAGSHGIVYVRVSTAHQADDELPVDSQIAELTAAVAAAGATCEVVKDVGISGADFEGRSEPASKRLTRARRPPGSLPRRAAPIGQGTGPGLGVFLLLHRSEDLVHQGP